MLSIISNKDKIEFINEAIASVDRLDELVEVIVEEIDYNQKNKLLFVRNDSIVMPLVWDDTEPPYVFPSFNYDNNRFLAIVFFKLGNHQKAFEYIDEQDEAFMDLLVATHIQYGYPITEDHIQYLTNNSNHNLAVAMNFGNLESNKTKQDVQDAYESAIKSTVEDSKRLFSVKHYVNLLMDNGMYNDAEKLIISVSKYAISDEEVNAMNHLLSTALKAQLRIPYDTDTLENIAILQQTSINYYESKQLNIQAGLILVEASEIANFQKEHEKAKDMISFAIQYFREENIEELMGEATIHKAQLLYNWSKSGSPQYYKAAINEFQNALKVFKRDTHPHKFAEIQHNLGLLYSEINATEQEKAIWTAFCASAFKEALKFYTKEDYPFEYAMVAHNYGTALMGFPEAKLHNNLTKAFDFFEEALEIRTAAKHPFERALTLLNQLELYWLVNNKDEKEEHDKYNEMITKSNEIFDLVEDKELQDKAKEHLAELEKLNTLIG